MPVQKRKITISKTGQNPSSSPSVWSPPRLNVRSEYFLRTLKPPKQFVQSASNTQVQDDQMGLKLRPCLCGLVKKLSCKRIHPLFQNNLSNHDAGHWGLCVSGRRLVCHDLYCRSGLHGALVLVLTVQIVQRRGA